MENTPAWHSYKAVDIDGTFYDTARMKELVEQLMKKASLVQAGLAEFSRAESFAFSILNMSKHDFLWEPPQPDNEDDDGEDD